MKVIHVPFGFRPDPVGGTEVYVEALAREQQRRGVDVVVAAPGRESTRHMDNGLPISRFGVFLVSPSARPKSIRVLVAGLICAKT